MKQYIDKVTVVAEIERRIKKYATIDVGDCKELEAIYGAKCKALTEILSFLDTLEVKEIDLELENENKNPKITVGTKIRLKTNPNVILSIISTDCHEDEFECSNGSVLSLKQIEKYYNIYIDENNGKQI